MADWTDATTFAHAWSRAVSDHATSTFLIFEGPDGSVAEWTYAEFDHGSSGSHRCFTATRCEQEALCTSR